VPIRHCSHPGFGPILIPCRSARLNWPTVETILRKLGMGMSEHAVLADHPRLTRDDILAAQAFAADYLASEELVYD